MGRTYLRQVVDNVQGVGQQRQDVGFLAAQLNGRSNQLLRCGNTFFNACNFLVKGSADSDVGITLNIIFQLAPDVAFYFLANTDTIVIAAGHCQVARRADAVVSLAYMHNRTGQKRDCSQHGCFIRGLNCCFTGNQFSGLIIVFFKMYDPRQQVYGLPDYIGGIHSVLLNCEATIFRRRYYNNGAHMGFILYTSAPNLTLEMES